MEKKFIWGLILIVVFASAAALFMVFSSGGFKACRDIALINYTEVYDFGTPISDPFELRDLFNASAEQIWDNSVKVIPFLTNTTPFLQYFEIRDYPYIEQGYCFNGSTYTDDSGGAVAVSEPCNITTGYNFVVWVPKVLKTEQSRIIDGKVEVFTTYISGDEFSEPVQGWLPTDKQEYRITPTGQVHTPVLLSSSSCPSRLTNRII